jgi:hypothetical protein
MAAQAQTIAYYVGEDKEVTFTMSPVEDITGWSITFTMRAVFNVLPVLIQKTVGVGITILNGPAGVFRVQLLSADTVGLEPGTYLYDVQRTDVSNYTELVGPSNFTLLQAVRNIP